MATKMNELREKDLASLQAIEKELTENLFAARLQKRTGQLENTAKIAQTKRELARVKTLLRARELGLEVIETHAAGGEKKAEKPAKKAAAPAKKEDKKSAKSAPKAKAKASGKSEKKTKAAAKPAKKAGKSAGKKK